MTQRKSGSYSRQNSLYAKIFNDTSKFEDKGFFTKDVNDYAYTFEYHPARS